MRGGFVTVMTVCALGALATRPAPVAAIEVGGSRGQIFSQSSTASPGVPFSFDYRPLFVSYGTPPFDVRDVNFIFDTSGKTFSALNIQLDSSAEVFSIAPLNGSQVSHFYYDPTSVDPNTITGSSKALIPQAWRDEGTDGIVSGHWWLSGASGLSTSNLFSMQMTLRFPDSGDPNAPEPAAALTLTIGGLMLSRRRRRI